MMTMATSTVDRTIPWCPSLPPTTSSSSITMPALNVEKFDACCDKQQSSSNLTILRGIPTREFHLDSTDAVVDPIDDGDDDRNITETTTPPPTISAEMAAPLPYQLELAALTADIERMKQRFPTHHQTPPTTDIQSALDALAAKIDTIVTHRPTVPLQPAAMTPVEPTPMPVSTTADLSHDDDDGNQPLEARCQPSRLTETFKLQAQMLRNLNTMVRDLIRTVDLIVAAIVPTNTSQKLALLHPPTTMTTICQANAFTLTDYLQNTQNTLWPPNLAASSNKLILKPSPYKKKIPAKPPFNRGRRTYSLAKTRKDSMRPP